MQGHHGRHAFHGVPHGGMTHDMHGCCCGRRRFLSRREKIEMLEEYRASLKNELEGIEEELKLLKGV
ncbi:MAG: hypothetical protein MUO26_09945 [Methanotrichaceae archaeon]|nr:hypothetical protein [Methanotrichaceae archaeon]